jgi:hypothetical protein
MTVATVTGANKGLGRGRPPLGERGLTVLTATLWAWTCLATRPGCRSPIRGAGIRDWTPAGSPRLRQAASEDTNRYQR